MKSEEIINQLLGRVGAENPTMDELFQALGQRVQGAQQEASQLGAQARDLRNAPAPTTDPKADLVTRALASVAGSFTGSDQPEKNAKDLIEAEKKQLLLKRSSDLARLDDLYDKAIDRAMKLEDTESALKYSEAKLKRSEERETLQAVLSPLVDKETTAARVKGGIEEAKIRTSNQSAADLASLDAMIDSDADFVSSNQAQLNNLPLRIPGVPNYRNAVMNRIRQKGKIILPQKARATLSALDGAMATLKQLEGMNKALVRGAGGLDMFKEGAHNIIAAAFKAGDRGRSVVAYQRFVRGLPATFVRAGGDVGTLNDQDIQRALNLVPSEAWETPETAADALINLHQWIDDKRAETVATFTNKTDAEADAIIQLNRSEGKSSKLREVLKGMGLGNP